MSQLFLTQFNFIGFLRTELEISRSSEYTYFFVCVRKQTSFIRLFLFVVFFVLLRALWGVGQFVLFVPFSHRVQGVGRTSTSQSLILPWIAELGVLCTLMPPSPV